MTTLRQAAQQALEALEIMYIHYTQNRHVNDGITALRTALAQEHAMHELSRLGQEIEQEPSQWRDMVVVSLVREGIDKHRARELADHFAAQPEQKVACRFCHSQKGCWAWQCYDCGEIDDVQKPTPPAAQPPPEWEAINNIIAEYGLQAISFVAEWKATLGQAEPAAWGVFEGNLHDMFFTQMEAQKMADLKGTHAEVRPLYTAAAQRPWQGLTKGQRDDFADKYGSYEAVCAIEQALKERNHD
jgi:hypothetical protein